MVTTSDESNQPKNGRPRRSWVRSLLLVLVVLVVGAVSVQWLLSQRFEAKIVEAGGEFFVDDHNRSSSSRFARLGKRFVNRLAGRKDQRLHHIRFVEGTVDDEWLRRNSDRIEDLSERTVLTLEQSRVTAGGLAALRGVRNVTSIDLSGTPLSADALEHIATMPDLWTLYISNTGISDVALHRLKQCPQLRNIKVDASQTTELGIDYIFEIPQLAALVVVQPNAETLSRLAHASLLIIEEAVITPQFLDALRQMRSLTQLGLIACDFDGVSAVQLVGVLPDCRVTITPRNEAKRRKAMGHTY